MDDDFVETPFGLMEKPKAPKQRYVQEEDPKPHWLFAHLFNEKGELE